MSHQTAETHEQRRNRHNEFLRKLADLCEEYHAFFEHCWETGDVWVETDNGACSSSVELHDPNKVPENLRNSVL